MSIKGYALKLKRQLEVFIKEGYGHIALYVDNKRFLVIYVIHIHVHVYTVSVDGVEMK